MTFFRRQIELRMVPNHECKYWHNTFEADIKIIKEEWPPDEMHCCKGNRNYWYVSGCNTSIVRSKKKRTVMQKSVFNIFILTTKSVCHISLFTLPKRKTWYFDHHFGHYINCTNPYKLNIYHLLLYQVWYYRNGCKVLYVNKIMFKF